MGLASVAGIIVGVAISGRGLYNSRYFFSIGFVGVLSLLLLFIMAMYFCEQAIKR